MIETVWALIVDCWLVLVWSCILLSIVRWLSRGRWFNWIDHDNIQLPIAGLGVIVWTGYLILGTLHHQSVVERSADLLFALWSLYYFNKLWKNRKGKTLLGWIGYKAEAVRAAMVAKHKAVTP